MKLEQYEFTGTLKGKIVDAERRMSKLCESLNLKYQEAAAAKNVMFKLQLSRTGYDSFSPYYCSEVTLEAARKEKEPEVHRIVIWECQHSFLGMPVKWNIPGSKISGNYMDESLEDAAKQLEQIMETFLELTKEIS